MDAPAMTVLGASGQRRHLFPVGRSESCPDQPQRVWLPSGASKMLRNKQVAVCCPFGLRERASGELGAGLSSKWTRKLVLCHGSADFESAYIWKECVGFASAVECCWLTFFCTSYNDSLCSAECKSRRGCSSDMTGMGNPV